MGGVHVADLAVDPITEVLVISDPVFDRILIWKHNLPTPIPILTVSQPRKVLVHRGRVYFHHSEYGVPTVSGVNLDGMGHFTISKPAEVVSHFDIDNATNSLIYLTGDCDGGSCVYKVNLESRERVLLSGVWIPKDISSFALYSSSYAVYATITGSKVVMAPLYGDSTTKKSLAVLPPKLEINNIKVVPSIPTGRLNLCTDDSCPAEISFCVNTPVDFSAAQLQPSCICKGPGQTYDSETRTCLDAVSMCDTAVYFQCKSGGCVRLEHRCDGFADCEDRSDESGCHSYHCPASQFKCNIDAQCIPRVLQCDGYADCNDGSDELVCDQRLCGEDEFYCPGTRTCIPAAWRCDGSVDCHYGNNEDEEGCEGEVCDSNSLSCVGQIGRKVCVGPDLVLDGKPECYWGQDESLDLLEEMGRGCDGNEFQCGVFCLPNTWIGDAERDCPPGNQDESAVATKACYAHHSVTPNGRCMSLDMFCDGWADLEDGVDERRCRSALRVRKNATCWAMGPMGSERVFPGSGHVMNRDGISKLLWALPTSPLIPPSSPSPGRCLTNKIGVCDGVDDCLDNSDEENGGCSHICQSQSDGTRRCECYYGFRLAADGRTCVDVNECDDPSTCSQTNQNFRCVTPSSVVAQINLFKVVLKSLNDE
eukprot:sb/3462868/